MTANIYRSRGAEAAAICHILMNRSAAAEMLATLTPDDFADKAIRTDFERLKSAYSNGMDIQTDDRAQSLLSDYIVSATPELMGNCRTAMGYLIDSTARERLSMAVDAAMSVVNDFSASNADFRRALQAITAEATENRASGVQWDTAAEAMDKVALRAKRISRGILEGVTTGFDAIDDHMLLRPGLYIIGARPSTGKTALCLSMVLGQIAARLNIGFCCTETGEETLAQRLVSQFAKIPYHLIEKGDGPSIESTIETAGILGEHAKLSFYCAKPNMSAAAIQAVATEWRNGKGLDCLYVDYLQDLTPMNRRSDRTSRVEDSLEVLKAISQDLKIPVVVAAQLRRETEGSQPELGHLKDASKIEEAAEAVALMWRPDREKKNAKRQGGRETEDVVQLREGGGQVKSLVNRAGIFVAKNKNGPTFDFAMDYDAPIMRFERTDRIELDR